VAHLGGTMLVESAKGTGTLIAITLPILPG
jgi:signal transduction histidine kinase